MASAMGLGVRKPSGGGEEVQWVFAVLFAGHACETNRMDVYIVHMPNFELWGSPCPHPSPIMVKYGTLCPFVPYKSTLIYASCRTEGRETQNLTLLHFA